ncbi:Asp-tRNA(Asn)/Glu-tRNA(Gln) amidotransferase subunit GatA [Helicobacter cholecystus]|uniref:Asp-tRNA(Asn)/Glu-tRNA(Gln) amidotransferase subunit GatA n=1 Tax=Helicobacter cholecystus TaxID=45498 RepID=UPI0027386078|nr:Asp-tRNA(Asn)/Glu-tRNA(Gln) amidotransferase subunit GatA [Helicobacter cholecystus]
MVTLKEALSLDESALKELKKEITQKVKQSNLNAYIGDVQTSKEGGVPILIKDNINVKGWEITCASKILKGYIAPYNATVIDRLHNHNMCGFGRANMDEFAMGSTTASSAYGPTLHPRDPSRVPGGSSGGGAAAVVGGLAIASLGSDTGGSIRQPAGFCGCVGLKPTYGSVSRYGLVAYSSSLDQIGPITQNVEDASILFDAISGNDKRDSTSAAIQPTQTHTNLNADKKFKIAVLRDFLKDATREIQDAYEKTISTLQAMGHTIIEKQMLDTSYHISAYYIICTAEASSNLARFDGVRYGNRPEGITNLTELYLKTRSEGFGEEVKRRIMLGSFVLSSGFYDAYYLKAQKVREMICAQFDEIFEDADVIFCPIAPSVAPKFGSTSSPLQMYLSDIYTISVNLAGLPALSLPVGVNEEGMPIGMQFIGKKFDEQSVLDAGYGLEKKLGKIF